MTVRDEVQAEESAVRDGADLAKVDTPEPEPESSPSSGQIREEEEPWDRAMRILRAPFPASAIGMLPKPVKRGDENRGPCEDTPRGRHYSRDGKFCGGWHAESVHLDYVGHAAVTDRLLDADPFWNWEPVATDGNGFPLMQNGTLWIRLTVAGVTRLGYGDAPGKRDATKELIGDAIRNAAMRFGVALDLWSKEDLHAAKQERGTEESPAGASQANGRPPAQRAPDPSPTPQGAVEGPAIDEELRSRWRQRVLSIEFLGNRPKEDGPDGGLRTAYQDAVKAGVMKWPLAPGSEDTFLSMFQRLAAELPERVQEAESPMVFDAEDPWAGGDESGWGNTGAGA